MPRPLRETSEDVAIRARVAVVGSGPAGCEVATWLAGQGHQVVVLESGVEDFDARHQDLATSEFVGRGHRAYTTGSTLHDYLPLEYRGLNRVRQLGGTSVVWTGKWRPLASGNIRGRAWLPESRWPIPSDEMRDAYREVARDYDIEVAAGDTLTDELAAHADALTAAGLQCVPFSQHASPFRTAARLGRAEGDRLLVLIDATVTRIDLADGSDRVARLLCRSLDGTERSVEAEHVVLATGGFDTPRLLLASNHQHPAGLGNGHDLVGRHYQDHLKIQGIRLRPGPLLARHAAAVQTAPAPRTMLSFGLPETEQEQLGVTEATVFLRPVYRRGLAFLRDAAMLRKAPRDGQGVVDHYSVKFAVEQSVNPESRVRLSRARDALGLPRLEIDWRLNDLDRHSFYTSARTLEARLRQTGFGRADLDRLQIDDAIDAAHHMGTARMGATPRDGVVDANCTVWGIPNLHIASSATFVTGGAYSPTFTIVALARRVAQRVDRLLGTPLASSGPMRRAV